MIKFLLTLGVGIYTGIYISQNYEVPRVDSTTELLNRLKEYTDAYKKK